MRISCSQWKFSLSPIYERKTWKNLNIEIQNFISIFVFRYSSPWRFCAQICTIANVLIANIMFAVKVLPFTHLRKKNLEKFEYRNTEFYFDFRFSIFAPLAFLCSNLYYSERAHCEYHVRSEGSHFHPSTKEKKCKNLNIEIQNFISIFVFRYSPPWRFCAQICTIANVLIANIMFAVEVLTFTHLRKKNLQKFNIEIQNFISIFVFRYSPHWRFCAQICTIANVLIANIMFAVKVLTFTHLRKKNLEKFEYRNTEFYFDFRFSIFVPLAFLCSNLYYSERAHCEYHVRSGGSHFHPSSKEKIAKI